MGRVPAINAFGSLDEACRARRRRPRPARPAAGPARGAGDSSPAGVPTIVRAGGDQSRGDHQLDRPGAGGDEIGDGRDRLVDAGKVDPGGRRPAGTGTVSKTASAMEPSVPSEPTSRRLKTSSGLSASRNAQRRKPVVFLISNLWCPCSLSSVSRGISSRIDARPGRQLRFPAALGSAKRRCRVDGRPGGKREGHRAHGRVGVGPCRSACRRVVGDHAADSRQSSRRVGAELAAVPGRAPGWRGRAPSPGLTRAGGRPPRPHAAEVAAHVDQRPSPCPWPLRLVPPVRRRRGSRASAEGERLRHVVGVVGLTTACGSSRYGLASEA